MLEQAQNEVEALRAELLSKDEEIERLRQASDSQAPGATQSLDSELFSSLKQQHALELSATQSQIRALEDSVFQAEAKSHALQKQVSALEDQLAHARSAVPRSFSPSVPSRPSSRGPTLNDGRRPSIGSHRPSHLAAPPISRSAFDQDLSPETLHKRKVSLSMLKARMDSETAAKSHPSTRAVTPIPPPSLPTVREPTSQTRSLTHHHHHRPQFMDETHVFWCQGCRGDLVVL
ncbi:hypothetical protein BDN72DRAFT_47345 [Pluteus cervinus]|uniref:Uncharacterized protein n=1 Tax=Pluteus cervinus TaxID=181527 RepID=A0ACD3BHK2_9AGAR|nr:hypothetical protein BDN72DRAFT_47345 [Pluteus cervinus]